MTLFMLADYILQTHAVQATSYTKSRAKQLWRLIVGDKDDVDEITVSQPRAVYITGRRRFWIEIWDVDGGGTTLKVGCFDTKEGGSGAVVFKTLDELGRILEREDLPDSIQKLIAALNLERVAFPDPLHPIGRLPREACTPP